MSEEPDLISRKSHLNLDFRDRIWPCPLTQSKQPGKYLVFWSQIGHCVVLAVNFEMLMLSSYEWLEQKNILSAWWWKTKGRKYLDFSEKVSVLIYEICSFPLALLSTYMIGNIFGIVTICMKHWSRSQNIVAMVLQLIVTSSCHYNDVIVSRLASQITSLMIVYSTVYSGADQRKHQSSASLAFLRGIYRWPVNFLHKGPVT